MVRNGSNSTCHDNAARHCPYCLVDATAFAIAVLAAQRRPACAARCCWRPVPGPAPRQTEPAVQPTLTLPPADLAPVPPQARAPSRPAGLALGGGAAWLCPHRRDPGAGGGGHQGGPGDGHLRRQPGRGALCPGRNGKELAQLADSMDEGAITDWSFLPGADPGEAWPATCARKPAAAPSSNCRCRWVSSPPT